MTTPNLTINNAILRAEEGSGDGTVYATATGTSNTVADAQANKRLTFTGWTPIADLPADTDDLMNGYVAVGPFTGDHYTIADWEAGLDRATLVETPAAIDIGDATYLAGRTWKIIKTLYAPDALASNPAFMACDGLPSKKFKIRAANVAFALDIYLPNLIGQGGFEELAAGAFPSSQQGPGIWGGASSDWTVAASSPLLGSRMALWTIGAGDGLLDQRIKSALQKGKRYRLVLKLEAVFGAPNAGVIRIDINDLAAAVNIDADWQGSGVWNVPLATTGSQWFVSSDLIPDFTSDAIRLRIRGVWANRGAATHIRVDEVYLWEVVPVSALLAFGHNWDGSSGPAVVGLRCPLARTGVTSADYVDLLAASAVSGSSTLRRTWTVADPFPIYRVTIQASTSFQYEVGELLLGQSLPLAWPPELPVDPSDRKYERAHRRALSGARTSAHYSQRRIFQGAYPRVPAADRAILDGIFREAHVDRLEPFAVYWPGESGQPDIWPPTLVQHVPDEWNLPYRNRLDPDYHFDWEEVQ